MRAVLIWIIVTSSCLVLIRPKNASSCVGGSVAVR